VCRRNWKSMNNFANILPLNFARNVSETEGRPNRYWQVERKYFGDGDDFDERQRRGRLLRSYFVVIDVQLDRIRLGRIPERPARFTQSRHCRITHIKHSLRRHLRQRVARQRVHLRRHSNEQAHAHSYQLLPVQSCHLRPGHALTWSVYVQFLSFQFCSK